MEIGQKVWYVDPYELIKEKNVPDEELLHETEITKIGRKYFYVKGSRGGIEIKTMHDKVNFGFGYTISVYLKKEKFLEARKKARKIETIRKFFRAENNISYLTDKETDELLAMVEKATERREKN